VLRRRAKNSAACVGFVLRSWLGEAAAGEIDEANADIRAALLIDARIAEKFADFGLTR
jgi:hypothetical protein